MEIKSVKEAREEGYIDTIKGLMDFNNGYITSKQITELGIHRMYLKIMLDKKMIKKVGVGIYIDKNIKRDELYIFQKEVQPAVFSHMTGLYINGIIKNCSKVYDLTVTRKYNNSKIKKHNIFYVSKDMYDLGLTYLQTQMGNIVKVYDTERCIIDIIRSRKRLDFLEVKRVVREYLKSKNKNLDKLYEYSKILGVSKEVKEFIALVS